MDLTYYDPYSTYNASLIPFLTGQLRELMICYKMMHNYPIWTHSPYISCQHSKLRDNTSTIIHFNVMLWMMVPALPCHLLCWHDNYREEVTIPIDYASSYRILWWVCKLATTTHHQSYFPKTIDAWNSLPFAIIDYLIS